MRVLAVLMAMLLLTLSPSAAQGDSDTRPPLLRVLSAAPDIADIRNQSVIASFADYEAALALRGLEAPNDLTTLLDMDSDQRAPYLFSIPAAGPEAFLRQFTLLGEMPAVMGFDFFDITQAAELGVPPMTAIIVNGAFDAQVVTDAHLARGYTAETGDFGTTLCPADGCDSGMNVDVQNRQMANPFGGDLGRSRPIIVNDDVILSTAAFPLLVTMSGVAQGRTPSLADAKDVQAVANILAYREYVSAVMLFSPIAVDVVDATASSGRFSNFKGRLDSLPPLPTYSLLAVSHTADAEYEYGDILLIYPDLDTASQAYQSIIARLEVVESVQVEGRTIAQLFGEWGEFLPPQVVTDEKTNFSALQLTLRTPLETENTDNFGVAYRRLSQLLFQRDTVLLLPTE